MTSGSVEALVERKYLNSEKLISAFREIARVDFVPAEFEAEAEVDMCLPVGCGQVISQPTIVATMLELLDVQEGQHVLDVGSGSGWTSALLGRMVGPTGKVVAIEVLPELYALGKKNIEKFGLLHAGIVECVLGDGNGGCEAYAPYDRILLSASVEVVPQTLKDQLKVGGKMVFPKYNHICYLEKRGQDDFYSEEFGGFLVVPLFQKSV